MNKSQTINDILDNLALINNIPNKDRIRIVKEKLAPDEEFGDIMHLLLHKIEKISDNKIDAIKFGVVLTDWLVIQLYIAEKQKEEYKKEGNKNHEQDPRLN